MKKQYYTQQSSSIKNFLSYSGAFFRYASLLALFFFITSTGFAQTNSSDPVHNTTQDLSFMTIQAAVDAATSGDVIEVAAGTYADGVNIDKQLTLLGAQASVDARERTTALDLESLITGNFVIGADEVIVDGFYFDFDTEDIRMNSQIGVQIRNNKLTKQQALEGQSVVNVLNSQPNNLVDGIIIEKNWFFDTGDGSGSNLSMAVIGILGDVDGIKIKDNKFTNMSNGAIYTWNDGWAFAGVSNSQNLTNFEISGNYISTLRANAIQLGLKETITGTINNNEFKSWGLKVNPNSSEQPACGGFGAIHIYPNGSSPELVENLTIENNTFNKGTECPDAGFGVLLRGGTGSAYNNVTVNQNSFTGGQIAVYLLDENVDATKVTVNNNAFIANAFGIASNGTGTLDATCNWWGTDVVNDLPALISGDVQFVPFSTLANPTNCEGVNPVVNTTQNLSYMTIQDAVDAASAEDVIEVSAGTFEENITINKSLTINGPNAGVACDSRVAEAVLAPTAGTPVTITADGVTLNGFEMTAPDAFYAVDFGGTSNTTVSFNNIHDIGTTKTGGGNVHAIIYTVGSSNTSTVAIEDNCLNNISSSSLTGFSASAIGILQTASTGVLDGLSILRNTISNVNVNTSTLPTGNIAYGILINVAGGSEFKSSTGNATNANIGFNTITDIEGYITTGIALEGNTENVLIKGNEVTNLTAYKLANRAGGGYNLNGLKFENNRFLSTVTVENNSFDASTFTHNGTSDLGYAVANYVPESIGGVASLSGNWFGSANYGDFVVVFNASSAPTVKILNKDGAETTFIPFLINSTIDPSDSGYSNSGSVPLVLNEALFDPPSDDDQTTEVEGDANNDGSRDASEDEFIEFFNNSNEDLNISGYSIFDSNALSSDTPRHVVPANTIISANSAYVVFGGGTPTGSFGTAIVQTASSGELNLTNSGDVIIVKNSSDLTVIDFDSDDLNLNFDDNQSITRSPDITGDYVLHTDVNKNLVYSPGLQVEGTTLSIQDNRLKFDITFYPNPVKNGFVNINSKTEGTKTVELYDLTGRMVMSTKLDTSTLDVSNIGSGIYLLKVTISNRTSTKKLIID